MKNFDKIGKKLWDNIVLPDFPKDIDSNNSWIQLKERINRDSAVDSIRAKNNHNHIFSIFNLNFQIPTIIAISLIIILPISIFYQSVNTKTVQTKNGKLETVKLSDGSLIKLNSGTKLSYKNNFNKTSRNITLSGEAFFDIKKSQKPFIIESAQKKIKVLGTKFNVQSRLNKFEVGVTEGQVLITQEDESIILTGGQRVVIIPSQTFPTESIASYENYPDWIHNKLYCEKKSLREVCNEIERKFDISINFSKPSIGEKTITGLLDVSNLKSVLSSISLLAQHEFKFDGDRYTIL